MTSFRPAAARLAGRALALAPRALDGLLASHRQEPVPDLIRGFGGQAAGRPASERHAAMPVLGDPMPASPRDYVLTETGIAVVPVIGPLVSRLDWLAALFGAMSYGEIGQAVESAAADPAVRAMLLELDSPGGEVGGLFDLVDSLAALRNETGKPLWAVASENALSAAYAIASIAATAANSFTCDRFIRDSPAIYSAVAEERQRMQPACGGPDAALAVGGAGLRGPAGPGPHRPKSAFTSPTRWSRP
jgi:hypothetical protein